MFAPITQEHWDELAQQHGELFQCETKQGIVYFRRPSRAEYQRCQKKAKSEDVNAIPELVVSCTVYPDRDSLKTLIDKCPGLPDDVGLAIIDVAKGDEAALSKRP